MPVKIRLQRHGKKGKPFYWIIAADTRAKRDGKYLEKIGIYNPNTNPATIELDVDGAVKWLQNGAQPTDTARAILSYKGALLKTHLAGGVRKGALTEEQAEEKFKTWLDEKEGSVSSKEESLTKAQEDAKNKALDAEKEVNAKRMAASAEAETAATEASEEVNEAEKAEGESENAELEAQAEKDVDSKTAEEAKAQEKKDA
ncbi:30S ribosomal protein S16 [Gillisia hiemivivida]|jgi:small subunit ribosomal protein S16|uniref:Small ribosomal subunit protein bS16 n=1 Tax=Gillisia hiemivivida TaxID=291190 RepID=A0A5C6ZT88_9FLAO|nr:30S ribosomal protein S16 [Gillisia hiemivivida]TXD93753.1 30S ribosomal protein S16 [Gillisia hiemivivida]